MSFNSNRFITPLFKLFGKKLAGVPPSPINNDIIVFNVSNNEWELQQAIIGNAVQSSSNVGTGAGLALNRVLDDLPFKTLVDGIEIVIVVSATELTFSIGAIAISKITGLQVALDSKLESPIAISDTTGLQVALDSKLESPIAISDTTGLQTALDSKIETITNVGAENEIAKAKVGTDVPVRTLKAGTNITIVQNVDDLEISATGGTGEINTGANVGTGLGKVFRDKIGVILNFKSILSGAGITVNNLADDIEIKGVISFMNNVFDEVELSDGDFLAVVGLDKEDNNESTRQGIIASATKLRRLAIVISTNGTGIASTFVLRVNGVTVNQSVTIPTGITGTFQDITNTDNISALDKINYLINKAGGDLLMDSSSMESIAQ